MPVFPKPKFPYEYAVETEIAHLRAHKQLRGIPERSAGAMLVATWNIANLGAQSRRDQDKALIAEILNWFDFVAVQECRENFADLEDIQRKMRPSMRLLMSDAAGNNERLTYLYDSDRFTLLEEVGEIAFPPSQYGRIKLPDVKAKFEGFDRTPYLAAFRIGGSSITFVNVHLYYGAENSADIGRRALETFAVAKWADTRRKSQFSFTRELVAMGDFNMPKSEPGDPIYNALTRFGLELPEHSTQIASSIASDANYDQMAFMPGMTAQCFTGRKGVFDYDNCVFPDLWQNGVNQKDFKSYLRYYMSDHRPMWIQLKVEG
ncbi:MAG TPA: endonuclease/exonuclease/phosphatase family protein [Anaerolineales bacterium]|nr:endonuclease/exonuclease/phosphatase family protein [Anaerolineales bacterium]